MRNSRCKASKLENGKRREDNQLADAEARLKCASVKKLHAEPYHRTRYDGCLTRVNVYRGVYVSNCTSCKDRQLLARTTVSCTYMSLGSGFLSRSSVKVVVDEFLAGISVWKHLIDNTDETRDGNDAG